MLTTTYLIAAVIVLFSAVLQGAGGIGFDMFAAPVIALFRPELVPGPMLLLGGLLALFSAVREFGEIAWGVLAFTLLGRVPAAFIAGAAISVIPVRWLSVVFALIILMGVAMSFFGWRVVPRGRNFALAGLMSGLMGTITSVGAPPLAIVFQDFTGAQLRATVGAYLIVGASASIVALRVIDRFGPADLWLSLGLVPPLIGGFALSNLVVPHIDRRTMRIWILGMAGAAALILLVLQFL